MDTNTFGQFLDAIKPHKNIVILGHVRTDCDCYSAMDFFSSCLTENGHSVTAVVDDLVADDLEVFIDEFELEVSRKSSVPTDTACDAVLLVDCQFLKGEKTNNVAAPSWLDLNLKPLVCIDHHVNKGHNEDYLWCHIDEEAKCMPSIFYPLLEEDKTELTKEVATIAIQGILKDTHNLSESTQEDGKCFRFFARGCDFQQIFSLLFPSLDRDSLKAFGIGLQNQKHISDICEFAFLGKITPDEFLGVPRVADELVNMQNSAALALSAAIVCNPEDSNKIFISIRDKRLPSSARDAKKVAQTLFGDGLGAGGDKYKAAADMELPLFREVCNREWFFDLIEQELSLRILASYLNRDNTEYKPIPALDTKEDLSSLLKTKVSLNEASIKQIARGLQGRHFRGRFSITNIHNGDGPHGPAIDQQDIGCLSCVRNILLNEKDRQAVIVYALVRGQNSMMVVVSVETSNGMTEKAETIISSLLNHVKYTVLENTGTLCTVKIELPLFKMTHKEQDLARAVFEEIEARTASLGESDYFANYMSSTYKQSKV